jgi:hypothetical protein
MLEVYVILDCINLFTIIHSGLCHITHSSMLTETDIQLVESIIALPESEIMTKRSLSQLKMVKVAHTKVIDKECFCSTVRRKVWYKDFLSWYEKNA